LYRLYSPSHPKSLLWHENGINPNSYKSIKKNQKEEFAPVAYEFILNPGEVFVHYPGWTYETWSIDDNTSVLSAEFRLPSPSEFVEHFSDIFYDHPDMRHGFISAGPSLGEQCGSLWKARVRVLEEMKAGGHEHFLLCEPSTFKGDCRRRHYELTGELKDEKSFEPNEDETGKKSNDNKWMTRGLVLLFLGKNIMRFYKKDDLKKLREMQEQQHQQYENVGDGGAAKKED